jgi:hypothetical protein
VDLLLTALEAVPIATDTSAEESHMNTRPSTGSANEAFQSLLVDLRYLARFDDLSCTERLRALDDAIERAITESPEPARDFIRDVMDGRVKP